jgi:hypothetical protein
MIFPFNLLILTAADLTILFLTGLMISLLSDLMISLLSGLMSNLMASSMAGTLIRLTVLGLTLQSKSAVSLKLSLRNPAIFAAVMRSRFCLRRIVAAGL